MNSNPIKLFMYKDKISADINNSNNLPNFIINSTEYYVHKCNKSACWNSTSKNNNKDVK